MAIPTDVISASSASDIVSRNNLHATFDNSTHLQELDWLIISGCRCLHYDLIKHLLKNWDTSTLVFLVDMAEFNPKENAKTSVS